MSFPPLNGLVLASRVRRIAAALADALASAPLALLLGWVASSSTRSRLVPATLAGFVPSLALLCYQSLLLVQTGQSIGKRLWRVTVVRDDGARVTLATVALRLWVPLGLAFSPLLIVGALHVVSGFVGVIDPSVWRWLQGIEGRVLLRSSEYLAAAVFGVDALFMLRPGRRCLHDDLARTMVLVGRPEPLPVKHWRLLGQCILASTLVVAAALVLYALGLVVILLSVLFPWLGHIGGG